MKRGLGFFLMLLTFYSCETKKAEEKAVGENKEELVNTSNQLVGEWTNNWLRVTIKGEDKDSLLSVNRNSWEEVLKIKPIVTTFNENGTYQSVYKDLSGVVMMETSGIWEVSKDSLYLTEGEKRTSYKMVIKNNVATFRAKLDWDNDGKADDKYISRQRKRKNDTDASPPAEKK